MLALAGSQMKHATMELGGKSPLIVFDDADVENAVGGAMLGNFYSTGQVCSNGTRVFVQKGIHDRFVERLTERTKKIRIGDPLDPETQMGPLISKAQHDKVLGYIAIGKAEGATLALRRRRAVAAGLRGRLLRRADHLHRRHRRDAHRARGDFRAGDERAVVRRRGRGRSPAPTTPSSAWPPACSRATCRAPTASSPSLQAGTCWINAYNLTPVEIPFGGSKQSGIGRENSLAALGHYSQVKSVYVETGDVVSPY